MELERGMLQMKENGRETETVGECKKRTCAETLQRAKDGENGTNAQNVQREGQIERDTKRKRCKETKRETGE